MVIDVHTHVFSDIDGMTAGGPTRSGGYGRVLVGARAVQVMPPLNARTEHSPEMLLAHMDWAGVDKAVLLQGAFYGECNLYVLDELIAPTARHASRESNTSSLVIPSEVEESALNQTS